MSDKDLKPCPFCGGKAKLVENIYYTDTWSVMCTNCYSESDRHHHDWNAIQAWNRRENNHE